MEVLQSYLWAKFLVSVIQNHVEEMFIGLVRTFPLKSQGNVTVERCNITLGSNFESYVATGTVYWYDHLPLACFGYNMGTCEETGMTPFKLISSSMLLRPGMRWSSTKLNRNEPFLWIDWIFFTKR